MIVIGFLHTADVHTVTFTGLLNEVAPGVVSTHVVDASLLADARARRGVDAELADRLTEHLRRLAETATMVVCTCSTISGAAESFAGDVGVPVIRVDRPMAERAIELGPRIAVVTALASTIAPTTELLRSVATAAGREVELVEIVCDGAWSHFEAGDADAYLGAIAGAVDAIAVPVDVIVLAQASMAPAAERIETSVPILSSPRLAVKAAVARSRAQ